MISPVRQIVAARYLVLEKGPPMEAGAILYGSGHIEAVDTLAALKRSYPEVRVTEYVDAVVVPLLVNAHTHLELTDFPRWARKNGQQGAPRGFVDWILGLIAVKKNLDQDSYRSSLLNGIEQSLTQGVGVVGDILAHHSSRSAYLGSSLAGILYLETLGQDPAMIRRLKKGLHLVLDEPFAAHINIGLSPHSPYTISRQYLRYIYHLCRQRGLRCCTHLAESEEELRFTDDSRGDLAERFYPAIGWQGFVPPPSGVRPTTYLDQQGGLFPENLLVHGVHLNVQDIELLARRKMTLALCPRSNAKLKVGKAPAAQLKKAGVRLVLGTDSLASNDSLSIWDEICFAAKWFHGELDAPTLFSMATQAGADALGVGAIYGSLQAGKRAAFQVIRVPEICEAGQLFEYFTSGVQQDDILQIYSDGAPLLSGV